MRRLVTLLTVLVVVGCGPKPISSTHGAEANADRRTIGTVRSAGPVAQPSSAPDSSKPRKSHPVVIKLREPAMGRAPHWIHYSVDLPPETTQGADFLWQDNGVWLNDQPSGVKILETLGRHEITVLIVGKNGEEYRGSIVVEVLDPYQSGRDYQSPSTKPAI